MCDEKTVKERRDFLKAGIATLVGLKLVGCSVFTKTATPDLKTGAEKGVVRIPVARVPWVRGGEGEFVVLVEGRDDKIILFRDPAGSLVALSMTCTHQGCDVEYDQEVGHVVCPCHGSEFANTGAVLQGPAKEPLRIYPVTVAGDEVEIRIGS